MMPHLYSIICRPTHRLHTHTHMCVCFVLVFFEGMRSTADITVPFLLSGVWHHRLTFQNTYLPDIFAKTCLLFTCWLPALHMHMESISMCMLGTTHLLLLHTTHLDHLQPPHWFLIKSSACVLRANEYRPGRSLELL